MAGSYWLKPWHYFSAALALALSGIHLGLHAGLLRGALWGKIPLRGRAAAVTGALLLGIVFCFGTYSLVRTNYASWLRRPMVSLSAVTEASHAPAFEEGVHAGGELPGGGNRDGKSKGGGKGLGLGKGNGQGTSRAVSPADVFRTGISYSSILLRFAIVTATLESGIRKVRRRQTRPQLKS